MTALARVLIVALIALFPVAGEWWRVVMPWADSGTAALALVLGYLLSFAINCLHPKEKASKRTVQNNGDGLDRLLFEATEGEHQITVTLASGKVYAGWLDWTPPNPGAADAYIRILPTMSGYRDAEQVVQWTTFYQDAHLALEEFDEPTMLGLKRMRVNRRGARHGFPLHQREWHRAAMLRRGIPVLECEARPGAGRHECRTVESDGLLRPRL